uniref:Short-chain alcohol dehydrogenase n=1 Tax=uncultured organism TaxID=155900 RepID=A0A089ZWQ2_9ZZZZ|nr:short-chain alcohol dehydrogenase [uncultured organism]
MAQYDVADRSAIVTGGAAGIGRATALAFARAGAKVLVADVNAAGGEETVRLIRESGGTAEFMRVDVTKDEQVAAMVKRAVDLWGGLDYAFNNAGIEGALAPTHEYPEEAWQRVIDINLTGVWRCMRYEIPEMLKRGGGAIVNCASILGLVGFANAPAYTAAKHGVVGLTKAAAQEYAQMGLRVNAICPGFIETPMVMERGVQLGKDKAAYAQVAALHPMNRLGKPEEIANAVLWLCSPEASFVTGYPLAVDGGYTAQ